MTLNPQTLLAIISGLGLLGGLGLGLRAFYERRLLRAKAVSEDATATAVLTAAARELIDPLRAELAKERRDHAEELTVERRKVGQVRAELQSAMEEARALRVELSHLREELSRAWAEVRERDQRIRELEEKRP